jgi:hypothetical protein
MGCKAPFRSCALAGQAKANLHPLAIYTIEFTSLYSGPTAHKDFEFRQDGHRKPIL